MATIIDLVTAQIAIGSGWDWTIENTLTPFQVSACVTFDDDRDIIILADSTNVDYLSTTWILAGVTTPLPSGLMTSFAAHGSTDSPGWLLMTGLTQKSPAWNTAIISNDDYYTHTAQSSDITFAWSGNYEIRAKITISRSSGDASGATQVWLEVDTGSGFTEIDGTRTSTITSSGALSIQTTVASYSGHFNEDDIIRVRCGNTLATFNSFILYNYSTSDAQITINYLG